MSQGVALACAAFILSLISIMGLLAYEFQSESETPPFKGQVWCAGCDQVVHSDWMQFVNDWKYRCIDCREVKPVDTDGQPVVTAVVYENGDSVIVQIGSETEVMTAQQYRARYVDEKQDTFPAAVQRYRAFDAAIAQSPPVARWYSVGAEKPVDELQYHVEYRDHPLDFEYRSPVAKVRANLDQCFDTINDMFGLQ